MLVQNDISLPNDNGNPKLGDLELFKMLLQPHFLFNSLNNLYALSIKQSDKTSEAIAALSELLEKVVSCAREDYIPVSREIELIEQYIRLEKIWLGETNFLLDFKTIGDSNGIYVPPLVLYTFVENCFKHGIRKCDRGGWLSLRIEIKEDMLYFKARNQVPFEENHNCQDSKKGLGVLAAKELLERKCAGNYELKNEMNGKVYCVDLRIYKARKFSA